jgi:hypothetical protein
MVSRNQLSINIKVVGGNMSDKEVEAHLERAAIRERVISSDALYEELTDALDGLRDNQLSALIEVIRGIQVDRETTRIIDVVS